MRKDVRMGSCGVSKCNDLVVSSSPCAMPIYLRSLNYQTRASKSLIHWVTFNVLNSVWERERVITLLRHSVLYPLGGHWMYIWMCRESFKLLILFGDWVAALQMPVMKWIIWLVSHSWPMRGFLWNISQSFAGPHHLMTIIIGPWPHESIIFHAC